MVKPINVVAAFLTFIMAMAGAYGFHSVIVAWIGEIDDFFLKMLLTISWFAFEFLCVLIAPILVLTDENLVEKMTGD